MKLYCMKAALLLAAFAALSGCAQLGLATPETFNQKVAVVLSTITEVRETATTLLQAKKITADDAQNVLASTDVARTGVDTARQIAAGDPAAGNARLDAVRTGLAAVAAYLSTRK
jgi:hypothetical protein